MTRKASEEAKVAANAVSSKPLARRTLRVPTMRHFLMRITFIAGA